MVPRICSLGYHSHTGWVIHPQIFLLYDQIEMNLVDYEGALERGNRNESTWAHIVSELLNEYNKLGLLTVSDYSTTMLPKEKEIIDQVLTYWFANKQEQLCRLITKIAEEQIKSYRSRLIYYQLDEPAYRSQVQDISTMQEWIEGLKDGKFAPDHRYLLKHYFEHIVASRKSQGKTLNVPIFEWESCLLFRNWLIQQLEVPEYLKSEMRTNIHEETEVKTLNLMVDMLIGQSEVLDPNQLDKFMQYREDLRDVRPKITKLNEAVWHFLDDQPLVSQEKSLGEHIELIRSQLAQLRSDLDKLHKEKDLLSEGKYGSFTSSAAAAFIRAAGIALSFVVPILPEIIGDALAHKVPDKTIQWLANREVGKEYPEFKWTTLYHKAYSESLLERPSVKINLRTYGQLFQEYREDEVMLLTGISKNYLNKLREAGLIPPPVRGRRGQFIYTDKHIDAVLQQLFQNVNTG